MALAAAKCTSRIFLGEKPERRGKKLLKCKAVLANVLVVSLKVFNFYAELIKLLIKRVSAHSMYMRVDAGQQQQQQHEEQYAALCAREESAASRHIHQQPTAKRICFPGKISALSRSLGVVES